MSSRTTLTLSAAMIALAIACSRNAVTPVSPSATGTAKADAAADGSTLKVTAPTLSSPINDAQLNDVPTPVANAVTTGV